MLQNIFSRRPPLYNLFATAELRALHPPRDKFSKSRKNLIEFQACKYRVNTGRSGFKLSENDTKVLN